MSLIRIALRIAAVEALKGRTLVGDNVLDSPNGALDIQADGSLRTDEEQPFVSIYTDDGLAENVVGRSLGTNGHVVLVIETGISMAMSRTNDAGETEIVGIQIPASDRAFEFHLDLVRRQVSDALSDPDNEWAEIYRSLHFSVLKIESGARRDAEDGQRLAGHQVRMTLELIDDPVKGDVLTSDAPFMRFLGALDASGDGLYASQAALMRAVLGPAEADWRVHQRRQGLTAPELLALGLGPIEGDEERATPPWVQADIDVDGMKPVSVE